MHANQSSFPTSSSSSSVSRATRQRVFLNPLLEKEGRKRGYSANGGCRFGKYTAISSRKERRRKKNGHFVSRSVRAIEEDGHETISRCGGWIEKVNWYVTILVVLHESITFIDKDGESILSAIRFLYRFEKMSCLASIILLRIREKIFSRRGNLLLVFDIQLRVARSFTFELVADAYFSSINIESWWIR